MASVAAMAAIATHDLAVNDITADDTTATMTGAPATTATLSVEPADDALDAAAIAPDDAIVKTLHRRLKWIVELDRVDGDRSVVEEPTDPPASRMSLDDYLKEKLGRRFHDRGQWAGRGDLYEPAVTRRRKWESIGPVRALTVHHAEGVPHEHPALMIRLIYKGHTSPTGRLDAADVGYHFFVDRSGGVWQGRDAGHMGTHVGSNPTGRNNKGNLGICGLGSFDRETPPKAMIDGIVELSELLSEYYGRPLAVRGHKDWVGINRFFPRGGIDCPGKLEAAVLLAQRRIEQENQLAEGELERLAARGESRGTLASADE
jgi:hypothetical protein